MRPYLKALVALGTAGLIALQTALADGWMLHDGITVGLAVLGAAGVYLAQNEPPLVYDDTPGDHALPE